MTGLAIALFAAVNLFQNPDYSMTDGIGGPVAWSLYIDGAKTLTATNAGDGAFVLTAVEPKNGYFIQTPLTLKPGAQYRLGAEVMCDLPEGSVFALQVQNHYFAKSISVEVPRTTGGKWNRIEWCGPMIASANTANYSIGFKARAGRNAPASVKVRNLIFEPMDEDALKGSKPIAPSNLAKVPLRAVPVWPLLSKIPCDAAKIRVYWPGPVSSKSGKRRVSGTIGGKRAEGIFGEDGYAWIDFGAIDPKARKLALEVRDAGGSLLRQDSYVMRTVSGAAMRGPSGRKLNNFVIEIHNGELKDGVLHFFRPEDGFVWISFTARDGGREKTARGYLDDCAVACVKYDPDEPHTETMRNVKAGWHRLHVKDAGKGSRVRIHAVKRLGMSLWGVKLPLAGPCSIEEQYHCFTTAFMRCYRLPGANYVTAGPMHLADPLSPMLLFLAGRGMHVTGGVQYGLEKPDIDREYCRKTLKSGMWNKGLSVTVDECFIGGKRCDHAQLTETIWEMYNEHPEREVSLFYADAVRRCFTDPKVHVSELAALANTGYGNGICLPELYFKASKDMEYFDSVIDKIATMVQNAVALVPAMKGKVYMHISPFTGLGHFTSVITPEIDVKHQYGMLAYRFATDPRFESVAGIGGGPTSYCEEELVRWTGRIFRYYGVEGGTENLAEKMGFRRVPGFVRNPDFEDGLEGWTVENGSVGTFRHRNLGNSIESRQYDFTVGQKAARFVTDGGTVNRLSQTLHGLEKGRHYVLLFALVNGDTIDNPTIGPPPRAFSAKIEGAGLVEGLTFVNRCGKKYKYSIKHAGKDIYVNTYRYVFRADSDTAKIVFEDRNADGSAAPDGTAQVINYIVIRPYYHEGDGDIAKIVSAIREGK